MVSCMEVFSRALLQCFQPNTSVSPSSKLLALSWHYSLGEWLAKMDKNVLQMTCDKVWSSGLANQPF